MKKQLENFRNTILSGILFLLPVFVIAVILQRAWKGLTGFGTKLAKTLGLETVGGFSVGPVITTLALLLIFFLCGLLVRIAMVSKVRNWLESSILKFIPGYVIYKAKMESKLLPPTDKRQPVLVQLNNAWKPGLLIEQHEDKAVVFMPRTPETDTGEVWVIEASHIKPLSMTAKQFSKSLELSGYGLISGTVLDSGKPQ